ncbi:amino acid ABC transporter ATP-binding protein [Kaistia adipata]|uniref:amino acid ABC transporter ATP-binding protein n=1 Tax=Kaistia adipata TaxID=166954 RepID=UPI00041A05AC|nr:amino acid ABC transporter ATP-binding protein [Kaistia adipata]
MSVNEAAGTRPRNEAVPGAEPIIVVDNVSKNFGPLQVLHGVSLEIQRGTMVAIVGRSGSGKSTLLRCINALEEINGGSIKVCGHPVSMSDRASVKRLRSEVGMVFQSYNLFPHLTVLRNITLALTAVQKKSRADADAIAHKVLGLVGLGDKAEAFPEQLSGGQAQRVAIARSLALSPKVLLFDEVTSALDPELTGEVLKVMEDLARDGMTMVLVTHEMAFARRVADIVVFMHQGKVWEAGPPAEIFADPKTPELRQFLSSGL